MRIFTLIWLGQFVSTIGSYMTYFALTLWAWDITGSATALALVSFFAQLPRIPITLIAGLIVDRFNRKQLMILGDAITALMTLAIGVLYLTGRLQIWHFYLAAMVSGGVWANSAFSLSNLYDPVSVQAALHPSQQHGLCRTLWLKYYRPSSGWPPLSWDWPTRYFANRLDDIHDGDRHPIGRPDSPAPAPGRNAARNCPESAYFWVSLYLAAVWPQNFTADCGDFLVCPRLGWCDLPTHGLGSHQWEC